MIKSRVLLFLCCLLVLPVVVVFTAARPARPVQAASTTVVINEVFNSNTGTNPAANEFFEIYNLTNAPIDLSTYVVYNKNGRDAFAAITDPTWSPIIPAYGYKAVPASILPGGDIGVGTQGGNPLVNVGLDSTADYVGLAVAGPTDTAIDAVNWGTVNPNWGGYSVFTNEFISGTVTPPPARRQAPQPLP